MVGGVKAVFLALLTLVLGVGVLCYCTEGRTKLGTLTALVGLARASSAAAVTVVAVITPPKHLLRPVSAV